MLFEYFFFYFRDIATYLHWTAENLKHVHLSERPQFVLLELGVGLKIVSEARWQVIIFQTHCDTVGQWAS